MNHTISIREEAPILQGKEMSRCSGSVVRLREIRSFGLLSPHLSWPTLILLALSLVALPTSQVAGSAPHIALAPPLVISTWPFIDAVRAAWNAAEQGMSAVDAVVEGCATCEGLQCDGTVGFGGSPDENGETTLDAMVMDGVTMDVGAVGALRYVKDAIRTAKLVLEHTEHTLLVGDQASAFALSLGVPGPANLSTEESLKKWLSWHERSCQPNFWRRVSPNSEASCGPYRVSIKGKNEWFGSNIIQPIEDGGVGLRYESNHIHRYNHDTISMAVIDRKGRIAAGTSSNGATHKIPGRIGDAPIVGASAYADQEVGACGATGDGDVMMRFLPCYQVVESMRQGLSPRRATEDAIGRIRHKYPNFVGALVAVNMSGVHGAACNGWSFQYSVISSGMPDVEVFTVYPSAKD